MTSSAGASGLIFVGSPPRSAIASRMVARSTTQGTPVKSCMITRAGVNWISLSGSASASQPASARMSSAVMFAPSSVRSRFSSRTLRLYGSDATSSPSPVTVSRRKISYDVPPTSRRALGAEAVLAGHAHHLLVCTGSLPILPSYAGGRYPPASLLISRYMTSRRRRERSAADGFSQRPSLTDLGVATDQIVERFTGYPGETRAGSAQQPRLDPGLGDGAVGLPLDDVRRDAGPVRDRLDQLGAVVDEADAVVGGVRGGQVALLRPARAAAAGAAPRCRSGRRCRRAGGRGRAARGAGRRRSCRSGRRRTSRSTRPRRRRGRRRSPSTRAAPRRARCARQTASRFATDPPPTQMTSWASRWARTSSTFGIVNSSRWVARTSEPAKAL